MTVAELTNTLQTLAHEGYSQNEVCFEVLEARYKPTEIHRTVIGNEEDEDKKVFFTISSEPLSNERKRV